MPSPDSTRNLIDTRMRERWRSDPTRYYGVEESFLKRPMIEADLDWDPATTPTQAEFRLAIAANHGFKSSGTNMTSALATYAQGGGVTLTTAGADNDQALLSPATVNTTVQVSNWGGTTGGSGVAPWLSAKEIGFEAIISLSSIADVQIQVGYKLTTTPTLATDADQVMLSFDTESAVNAARWRCVTSVANVDTDTVESNGAFTVAAATDYRLAIRVGSNRQPTFFINGVYVGAGPALTTPMAFIPVVALQALAGAAKAFTIRRLRCDRLY